MGFGGPETGKKIKKCLNSAWDSSMQRYEGFPRGSMEYEPGVEIS
jgi:hypothetical protein